MNRRLAFVGTSHCAWYTSKSSEVSLWKCSLATRKDTIVSWNVNSLRSLLLKQPNAFDELIRENEASILCLQETKLSEEHEKEIQEVLIPKWHHFYHSSSTRSDFGGTGMIVEEHPITYSRHIGHPAGDNEGSVAGMEFTNCYILSVNALNSEENLKRLHLRMEWDSCLRQYIRMLRLTRKSVIVVGNFNVARNEMDVWDEERVSGTPGYSDAERESFEDLLETCGMVDVFREFNPFANNQYTSWDSNIRHVRDRNRGMRLDYMLVSDDMVGAVDDVRILDRVTGSDHCPVVMDLKRGIL